jgi:hypothetical protein
MARVFRPGINAQAPKRRPHGVLAHGTAPAPLTRENMGTVPRQWVQVAQHGHGLTAQGDDVGVTGGLLLAGALHALGWNRPDSAAQSQSLPTACPESRPVAETSSHESAARPERVGFPGSRQSCAAAHQTARGR